MPFTAVDLRKRSIRRGWAVFVEFFFVKSAQPMP
jgi:hypothetical protein